MARLHCMHGITDGASSLHTCPKPIKILKIFTTYINPFFIILSTWDYVCVSSLCDTWLNPHSQILIKKFYLLVSFHLPDMHHVVKSKASRPSKAWSNAINATNCVEVMWANLGTCAPYTINWAIGALNIRF